MVDLNKKITHLEEEIEGYKNELRTASSAQEKSEIRHTINTTRETLNRLMDEKRQSLPQGKLYFVRCYLFDVCNHSLSLQTRIAPLLFLEKLKSSTSLEMESDWLCLV